MLAFNQDEIMNHIKEIGKANYNAMRKANRHSLAAARKTAWSIAKAQYFKLPKSKEQNKNISFKQRTSKMISFNPSAMHNVLKAEKRRYSLIHSVVGSRHPSKKRKPITVKIAGRKSTREHGQFISSPKKTRGSGVTQVFMIGKKGKWKGKFIKQTNQSLWDLLNQEDNAIAIRKSMESAVSNVYREAFDE